jgi:hypothetical protein
MIARASPILPARHCSAIRTGRIWDASTSELRLQLISPSTSPNELNTTLTPHNIIPRFAYFNKIWGILPST